MNIIFLGAPGSGKGTQAAMLSTKFKIPAISVGEALRKEVDDESQIGKLARSYMDSGKLVPDEIVIGIVANRLNKNDCSNGFILDGFPRNISQAEELQKIKEIDIVIDFTADEEEIVKRIAGRFSCRGCGAVYNSYSNPTKKEGVCDKCGSTDFFSRSDDSEDTVKNRLAVYRQSTFPLISFYQKKNLLVSISSVKGAPLVFEALIEAIESFSKKNNYKKNG
jgi:adenylate kinase